MNFDEFKEAELEQHRKGRALKPEDEIKQLAEKALKVQNKDMMDAVLRQIVKICERPKEASDTLPRKVNK